MPENESTTAQPGLENLLHETRSFPPSPEFAAQANATPELYEEARDAGLSTQVNTVIAPHDVDDLEALGELVDGLGVALWEVFCLVPVGRARIDSMVDADAMERVFHRLYDASRTLSCDLKVTAGPHYNRIVLERRHVLGEQALPSPWARRTAR